MSEDLKAIDIQKRIFSVDIEKHKKFSYGYEIQQVGTKDVLKGVVQKSGLSYADRWKAIGQPLAWQCEGLIKGIDYVGIELVDRGQFMTYYWHDKKRVVIVTLDEMDKIVGAGKARLSSEVGDEPEI